MLGHCFNCYLLLATCYLLLATYYLRSNHPHCPNQILYDYIYATHHPYPEDIYWLIEISNKTLDKDLKEKTVTYARNGIPEYWVIDLPHKKLWVFTQPQSDRYQNFAEFTTGTIAPVAFPDLEVEINQLLII